MQPPHGNNGSDQDQHHQQHLHNQHKERQPEPEMHSWRRSILPAYSSRHYMSMSLILTEDEELAIEGLLLLHKQPALKFLERRADVQQNKMIFSRTEGAVDEDPITGKRKEDKLEDTHRYECKTCNRRFSSFQALGGHRTSHKKPKPTTVSMPNSFVHSTFNRSRFIDNVGCNLDISLGNSFPAIASSSVPPSGNTNYIAIKKKKVHECSICGTKFFSGQALGGHMRRHRTVMHPLRNNSPQATRSSSPFSLDLNLPAPYEIDLVEPTNSYQPPPPSASTSPPTFSLDNIVDCGKDTTESPTSFRIDRYPMMTIDPEQNTKP